MSPDLSKFFRDESLPGFVSMQKTKITKRNELDKSSSEVGGFGYRDVDGSQKFSAKTLQAKFLLDGWKLNFRGVYCIKESLSTDFFSNFSSLSGDDKKSRASTPSPSAFSAAIIDAPSNISTHTKEVTAKKRSPTTSFSCQHAFAYQVSPVHELDGPLRHASRVRVVDEERVDAVRAALPGAVVAAVSGVAVASQAL